MLLVFTGGHLRLGMTSSGCNQEEMFPEGLDLGARLSLNSEGAPVGWGRSQCQAGGRDP